MIKWMILAPIGVTLLLGEAALAQTEDQCNQVRAAVAQYGYKAAKAHADATMSHEEVLAASACLKSKKTPRKRHIAR